MKNYLSEKINSLPYEYQTRDYIGASTIGNPCLRYIWYEYHFKEKENIIPPPPHLVLTWEIGKSLELLIIDWLRKAGIDISLCQKTLKSRNHDFFRGHVDAIWIKDGEEHAIIEIKTANNKNFNDFDKNGLKYWNRQYYCQLQSYMGMSGIKKTYVLVLNKDTGKLCDELIEFDEFDYRELELKALIVYKEKEPLPRVNSSPLWYQCKVCKYRKVCHD